MVHRLTLAMIRICAAFLLVAVLVGATIPAPRPIPGPPVALAQDDDDDDRTVTRAEAPVTATEPLGVDVSCEWDSTGDRSTCAFVPVGVDETAVDLLVPVQGICADIVGGDYLTEPSSADDDEREDGEDIAYYSSRSDETEVVLVMTGEVSTSGSTIYWIVTGEGRQPAAGLGLLCAIPVVETPEPSPTPAAAAGTGLVTVQAYRCDVAAPPDAATFDWYGECDAPGDDLTFELSGGDRGESVETRTSDDDGLTTFPSVDPGTYRLDLSGADWCHAESDSVDAGGDVVVAAGAESTVWIFTCADVEEVK